VGVVGTSGEEGDKVGLTCLTEGGSYILNGGVVCAYGDGPGFLWTGFGFLFYVCVLDWILVFNNNLGPFGVENITRTIHVIS
jgi:hypothetical protein